MMSVWFNNEHNLQQKEYKNRQVCGRIGEKRHKDVDNLLVFGYACNLFYDEAKALHFDEGKHLIPWMGDESLLIDRYDGRLLLDNLSQFGLKSSSGETQLSDHELEVERQCDKERYLALEESGSDNEYEEEEEMKRFKAAIASEGSYNAVGFSYDQYYPQYNYNSVKNSSTIANQYYPYTGPQNIESVNEGQEMGQSSNVQHVQEEEEVEVFVPPEELGVPNDVEVPNTAKLHAIIERTAFFIKDHGAQMEIVVKAKQSGNPQFGFLHFDDVLNPYYKLILKAVRNGTYEPMSSKPATPSPQPSEDESQDSDEEMELHPLLTASLRTPIRPTKKVVPLSEQPLPAGWTAVTTEPNSWKSSNVAKVSSPGTDGTNMVMPYHPGYAVHSSYSQSSIFLPSPPPPGVSQLEADDPEKQSFPSSLPPPPFPPGMVTPLYSGNHGSVGVSLAASDLANYTTNVGPPIIPPPPDLKPICDKLAKYVARNGKQFEDNIKAKGDPRFDFLNETSDHYTYYHMKRKEYEMTPSKTMKTSSAEGKVLKSLVPYAKPVSFQIKLKDAKRRPVIEYRTTALFKSAKADESDEEETTEEQNESEPKDSCEDGKGMAIVAPSQPDVQGPKTQEDVMAEERTTKLKQEKEKEVQRLEEEAKSTTSSLRRQVQLERRRRAQLFINMLKKTKPTSEESSSSDQNRPDSNNIFEPQVPN